MNLPILDDEYLMYDFTYTDLAIRNIFKHEAETRGAEFKLVLETPTERLLTTSDLDTLHELLDLLRNPGEMTDSLREFFDGYFGASQLEIDSGFRDEDNSVEYRMAA